MSVMKCTGMCMTAIKQWRFTKLWSKSLPCVSSSGPWNASLRSYRPNRFYDRTLIFSSSVSEHIRLDTLKLNTKYADTMVGNRRLADENEIIQQILSSNSNEELAKVEEDICTIIDTFDISEILQIADAFYVKKSLRLPFRYFSKITTIAEEVWNFGELSVENVIQFLFYMACIRSASVDLMNKVNNWLLANLENISAKELALVCYVYNVTNYRFVDETLLDQICEKILTSYSDMNIYELMNVLKSLKRKRHGSIEFYNSLGNIISESIRTGPTLGVKSALNIYATVLSSFAAVRIKHDYLFALADRELLKLIQQHKIYKMKDLQRIMSAFHTLQYPVPDIMRDTLMNIVDKDYSRFVRNYPGFLLECLVVLAEMKVFHPKAISEVFAQGENILKKTSFDGRQLLWLDTLVGVYCPQYAGCRAPKFVTESREHKFTVVSPKLEMSRRKGLAELWMTLQDLLGGLEYVQFRFPHRAFPMSVLEICVDSDGVPQKWSPSEKHKHFAENIRQDFSRGAQNADLLDIPDFDSSDPPENVLLEQINKTRMMIVVCGRNQYLRNAPLMTGSTLSWITYLHDTGNVVLVINPADAAKLQLESEEDRRCYVQEHVLDRLQIPK